MKKTFLKIAAISIISVSGVATFNIIQPTTYAQSKKNFLKMYKENGQIRMVMNLP